MRRMKLIISADTAENMSVPMGIPRKLTSSKWVRLAKCSQDTAYRDIKDLMERSALVKKPGGGS